MRPPRLLVLACDAADPAIILGHLDRLPSLAALCREGARGEIESLTHSCDIWTTYYTGLAPEQHGVQASRLATAQGPADLAQVKTDLFLWDWVEQHGLTVGFVEPLHAYPAPPVKGFFLSGQPRPAMTQTKLAVQPPELARLVDREYLASVPAPPPLGALGVTEPFAALSDERLRALLPGYFGDLPARLRAHLDWYAGLVERLWAARSVDLLWVYFIEADIAGHFTMHESPPETLIRAYEELDRTFGRLIAHLQPESVLLLSDHGMVPIARLLHQPQTSFAMQMLAEEYRLAGTRVLGPDLAVVQGYNRGLCTGTHADRGFYAGRGPRILRGVEQPIHFHDVFRLVLRTLGLPVPDGRVGQTPPVLTEFGGQRASRYDQLAWAGHQGYLEAFLDFADLQPSDRVLEVGVGTGTVAAAVRPRVAGLTGIDHSAEMLAVARTKLPDVTLIQADLTQIPLPSGSYDRVLARSVLHHMTSGLADGVAEIYRLLAPGGRLVIGEGIPPSPESVAHFTEVFRLKEERLVLLPEHLVQLLESQGFIDLEVATYLMPQVSIRNWLEQSNLAPALQSQLLEMHRSTPPEVQRAYRTRITVDDVLVDFTFALIKGRKPEDGGAPAR